IPYSEAAHCALIALQCAKSHRPFNAVLDEDYRSEVEMLHPGTTLPHPTTVSTNINHLYMKLSDYVCNYFMVCAGFTFEMILNYF
ncbi:hypothetical protein BDQ12DRAFT_607016, partial [Crucibulum laeve]